MNAYDDDDEDDDDDGDEDDDEDDDDDDNYEYGIYALQDMYAYSALYRDASMLLIPGCARRCHIS